MPAEALCLTEGQTLGSNLMKVLERRLGNRSGSWGLSDRPNLLFSAFGSGRSRPVRKTSLHFASSPMIYHQSVERRMEECDLADINFQVYRSLRSSRKPKSTAQIKPAVGRTWVEPDLGWSMNPFYPIRVGCA